MCVCASVRVAHKLGCHYHFLNWLFVIYSFDSRVNRLQPCKRRTKQRQVPRSTAQPHLTDPVLHIRGEKTRGSATKSPQNNATQQKRIKHTLHTGRALFLIHILQHHIPYVERFLHTCNVLLESRLRVRDTLRFPQYQKYIPRQLPSHIQTLCWC